MDRTETVFKAILALVCVAGFHALVFCILLLIELDAETKKLIAMGALATDGGAFATAIGYWLGSSSDSSRKTSVISNLSQQTKETK